jgi:PAP2 superfamily
MGRRTLPLILIASLLFVNTAALADVEITKKPAADDFSSEVASAWFELLYDVVKAERTTPPVASRIYGIAAVALYEGIVSGTQGNRSLVGQLNGLSFVPGPKHSKKYHWPTVANTVLAYTIRGLFPILSQASLAAINNREQSFAAQYRSAVGETVYERSLFYGLRVASAILFWAAADGFVTNNNCPYVPVIVPGGWEPTPPAFSPNPLQPCWGLIRPMVLTSGRDCPPHGNPPFSTDTSTEFYKAGLEVYNVRQGLTAEQKTIADYWADGPAATGTPPGHWFAIVSQIARNDALSLARAAEAYARVGIAVHDAFIACWNAKYTSNLQRPVTYINRNIDASWRPYIVTPNFPTYTSGHSTQSGAAASVLTDMFGVKSFTDTTHTDHGLVPSQQPRKFSSFVQAANEAAISRLYGGIHYSFDNNDGLTCGQCIGGAIHDRVSFKTN